MSNWKHHQFTNDELKKIVRDIYDQKIFTSLQCDINSVSMVFMPMFFLGSGPSKPPLNENNQINRKNKLNYIEESLKYEKETPEREEYIKNIGMLFEDMSKAGSRSINGYPIFYSCKIMSIEDTKKFIEMYRKYEDIRKNFEKEW
jgi:hypothetical protein